MLASYLGKKDFRAGLHHYLKKHSYKNTETLHLWQAFEKVSGKPVAKMMHNWTSKAGYPVVKAEIKNGKLALSQERFFASPISKKKSKDKTIWQVPLHNSSNVQYQSSQKSNFLPVRIFRSLKNPEIGSPSLAKPLKKLILENSYLKVNFGETGFFRTAYSKELLEKLREPIKNKKLNARDRLGVIRDLFALSEAGTIPTTDALEFLSAYKNEDNYTVWLEIAMGLARLEQLIAKNKKVQNNLNNLILDLFSPTMKRLGWHAKKNEMHTDTLLRSLCISRLGRSGHKEIINKARIMFKTGKINPDIRGAVYSVIASNGGTKEYRAFVARYKKETLHEEKNRIGGVLGDFSDPKILKLTCEFAMSKYVRTQDTVGIISSVGANPNGKSKGRDIWWSFIQKNWQTLVTRYGDGGHTLARLIKAISGSAEEKHLKSFKKFFATHEAPGAKRAIEQVKERLEGNTLWLKRDGKQINKFLK